MTRERLVTPVIDILCNCDISHISDSCVSDAFSIREDGILDLTLFVDC